MIEVLRAAGADLDVMNDEGFTALNYCLANYVAVDKDLEDWGQAFMPHVSPQTNRELTQSHISGLAVVRAQHPSFLSSRDDAGMDGSHFNRKLLGDANGSDQREHG